MKSIVWHHAPRWYISLMHIQHEACDASKYLHEMRYYTDLSSLRYFTKEPARE